MESFSADLSESIKEVINELINLDPSLGVLSFDTEISEELRDRFLNKFDIAPSTQFLEQLKTPFSIAKYLLLMVSEKQLIEEVEPLLKDAFKNSDILFTFEKNFSNTIIFSRVADIDEGKKAEDLRIRFYKDSETEEIKYHICSGYWGIDISLNQLVGILLHTNTENALVAIAKPQPPGESFRVTVDNVEIIVKKIK